MSNTTRVTQGQLLGYSGGVANEPGSGSSTGAHIHWHINDNGTVVDPAVYVAAHPTNTTPVQEEDDDMAAIVSIKNAQGNMDYWMIDDGQATRWNAILGLDVNSAGQRLDWYRARGMKFYENQPPHFITPYVDITSKRAAGQA